MQHLKNQEIQPLWNDKSSPKLLPRINNTDPFICGYCHKTALTPVISACAHICCWHCVHQHNSHHKQDLHCPTCNSLMYMNEFRPIYISGEDHDHAHISTRPKPTNIQPIRNTTGFVSRQTSVQHLSNNIQIGKQVPSYCMLPSNFVLAFSNFQENIENIENTDEKNVTAISIKLQKCLLISIVLIVVGVLLLSSRA